MLSVNIVLQLFLARILSSEGQAAMASAVLGERARVNITAAASS